MCDPREAGRLAFAQRVNYEMNPHVPGGLDVAARCRLMDWPADAREWHRGWSEAATRSADAAEAERLAEERENA